jgi:hypothetical protein
MKPLIVAFVAASLALGASATGYVLSHEAVAAQPGCTDDCSIAAHRGQASAVVAADGMSGMPGMQQPESSAMSMPMHGGHMEMTPPRAASAQDRERADAILAALRTAMAPYQDYRAAEAAGYEPFHPEFPQPIYHFTNLHNAMLNQFSFDPSRPTSLMYQPVAGGYRLVGAMYTAPRGSTLDQLDERVPLGIATWHLHVNLCLPPAGMGGQMLGANPKFGLAGSITTADACAAAGGTFKPVVYGWMVHVWPYESDPTKVWATEDHPGAMDR